jgi:PiT family inorganic phosphate transporter
VHSDLILWIVVATALAFDFTNGFHDTANSIATSVSTRAMSPRVAVIMASGLNFAGAFLSLAVAATIASGIVEATTVTLLTVFAGLVGAIAWNLTTWWFGLPSSSSHALIGGLVGAGIAKVGPGSLIASGLFKVVAFILVAPLLGMTLAALLILATSWIFVRSTPWRVDWWFRRLQLVSAALYSLGHGGNDAQKTAGIIWLLLIAAGYSTTSDAVPGWVVSACYVTIAFGTLFGGWRIVKTMGQRITKLKPVGGFCAETGGAMTLFLATAFGIPVSTTHTITGAIVGVGAARNTSAVRWGVAGGIVWAWVLTIPCSAIVAAFAWWFGQLIL